jgi:hypothetical protein
VDEPFPINACFIPSVCPWNKRHFNNLLPFMLKASMGKASICLYFAYKYYPSLLPQSCSRLNSRSLLPQSCSRLTSRQVCQIHFIFHKLNTLHVMVLIAAVLCFSAYSTEDQTYVQFWLKFPEAHSLIFSLNFSLKPFVLLVETPLISSQVDKPLWSKKVKTFHLHHVHGNWNQMHQEA